MVMHALAGVLVALLAPIPLAAQSVGDTGALRVIVRDQSGAVLVGAEVSLTAADAVRGATRSTITSDDGVATFARVTPDRYTIRVAYSGFETVEIRDYRLRAGDNRRDVTLPLAAISEGIDVGRDARDSALDPGGPAFSTILTQEQIDALPDDPDEMEAVLRAMSPPGSAIRVDGFSGGRLPSKSQIRSIRLPRGDSFAAQNHGGFEGISFIDIMTQPGLGRFAGTVDAAIRDDRMNARNPFTPAKGAENLRQYGMTFSGPVVTGRSSFSVSGQVGRQRESAVLFAVLPDGAKAEAVEHVTDRSSLFARFDQAVGVARTLRASYSRFTSDGGNLGVGGYDLRDRAYWTTSREQVLRVSENGPIGRSLFSETRAQLRWSNEETTSLVETPTVRVLDSFTSGGAQRSGGRRAVDLEAAGDVDFVRGAHSYRAGVLIEGGWYRSDAAANYLGTWTYSSMATYLAGRPSHYSRRTGDPAVRYGMMRVGAYVQDDYRVTRSLLVSYGVRYELQSYSTDRLNVSPRVSVAWAPFRSGNTTLRAGYGRFSDWIPSSVYEQARLVDGERFLEISIHEPSYPDPGAVGDVPTSNRYVLSDHTRMPGSRGFNVGVSQMIAAELSVSATYARRTGSEQLRGRNDNAAVNGVRPDARYADVVRAAGDAASRGHVVMLDASFGRPRWHRVFAGINYNWSAMETNSTGAFLRPASPSLDDEWGPTGPRHRLGGSFSARFGAVGVSLNGRAQSGVPYTMTTGFDVNGDGVFNDRPEGVSRNSLRTPATWDVGGRLSWVIGFGRATGSGGGGGQMVVVREGGGSGMPAGFDGGAENARMRLEFYVSAQNLTNRTNYTGYSGVITSPFFGQPTNVMNPRKVQIGVRVGF
jgi:hypothetical protein